MSRRSCISQQTRGGGGGGGGGEGKRVDMFVAMAWVFMFTTTPLQLVKRWPRFADLTGRPLLTCMVSFTLSCAFYAAPFALIRRYNAGVRRTLSALCCGRCKRRDESARAVQTTPRAPVDVNSTDVDVAGVYVRRSFERIARRARPRTVNYNSETRRLSSPISCASRGGGGSAGVRTTPTATHSSFRRRTSWTSSPLHARRHYEDRDDLLETDLGGVACDVNEGGVACEVDGGGVSYDVDVVGVVGRSPHKGVILCDTDEGVVCKHSICLATLPRAKQRRIGVTTFLPLALETNVVHSAQISDEEEKEHRVRFIN